MRKWIVVMGLVLCASMVSAEYEYKVWREQVGVSYAEAMNSYGDYFRTHLFGNLIQDASTWALIDLTTATKNVYLTYEVEASSAQPFTVHLHHTPIVISSGSITGSVDSFNEVTFKKSQMTSHLYEGDGVIGNIGTLLWFSQHSGREIARNPVTWVLKKGKVYIIKATNKSTTRQDIMIRLHWFEK